MVRMFCDVVRDDGCFGGRATQFCDCACYLGLFAGDDCTGMKYYGSVYVCSNLVILRIQSHYTNRP